MSLREVQLALERIQALEHVTGYVCMTSSGRQLHEKIPFDQLPFIFLLIKITGIPVRTTFDEEYTKNLVIQLQPFLERIKRTINHTGLKDVVELRLKTSKLEYLLRTDDLCSFIVVQRREKLKNKTDE